MAQSQNFNPNNCTICILHVCQISVPANLFYLLCISFSSVPELDLGCFKAEPKTVLPEQYDYVLDSGRSGVSTIR